MPTKTSYTITVDGTPLDAAAVGCLQRVECEEHLRLADVLRLRFRVGPKPAGAGWQLLDDGLFPRLAAITLDVRLGTTTVPLFAGHVVETAATFTGDPADTGYTVLAFDPSVLLHLESRTRAWPNMSDADVATSIFSDAGFATDVQATSPTPSENTTVLLQAETDAQLLQRLAARNGYDTWVDQEPGGTTTGHFRAPDLAATPQDVLSVGLGAAGTVEKLSIRHDMLKPAAASARAVDHAGLGVESGSATAVGAPLLGRESLLPADQPRTLALHGTATDLSAGLQAAAQAATDRSAMAITADCELNTGTYGAVLRAKRPVLVRGAGPAFSGSYLVERVLHVMEGTDYRQYATLRRNATGLAGEDFTSERGS